jgi:hypothetical protein
MLTEIIDHIFGQFPNTQSSIRANMIGKPAPSSPAGQGGHKRSYSPGASAYYRSKIPVFDMVVVL